jgi:hypothetical protein
MATTGEAYARERKFRAARDRKTTVRLKLLKLLPRTQLDQLLPQKEAPWMLDRLVLEQQILKRWNQKIFDEVVENLRFCR